MLTIAFRFPAGRYHATPWGNHVNEGLVEWPPSPWRIARALLATGFSKLGWREVPAGARELMEALASELPEYVLPPAVASHTRHFMPTDSKNPEDRTKIFDAFARIGRAAEVVVRWSVDLPPTARAALEELVPKVSYLGRAESIVEARLVGEDERPEGDIASATAVNRPGLEPMALLAPMTSAEYSAWIREANPRSVEETKTKKTKSTTATAFPPDALAALLVDTRFLQEHGWTQPPGSRRVFYYRTPLSTSAIRAKSASPSVDRVNAALFALASDTKTQEVLPAMTRALPQMELLHRGLLSRLGDVDCPELTGRDAAGSPLTGHAHSALIPLDLDRDGRLDHVLVHAPMGFGASAQRALRAIRSTFTKGGDKPLYVTLVGLGDRGEFGSLGAFPIREMASSIGWTSATPFVPPRHLKRKRHTLEDQVQCELASRGLPRATDIEVLDRDRVIELGFHRFVRTRRDPERAPPAPVFFGLRLRLSAAVEGPLSLGYASHFGLGLFVPAP